MGKSPDFQTLSRPLEIYEAETYIMHFHKRSLKPEHVHFSLQKNQKKINLFLKIEIYRIHGIPSSLSLTEHILQSH